MSKVCIRCGATYQRRDKEPAGRWKVRQFCGRTCSDAAKTEAADCNIVERFNASWQPNPNTGCWDWTALRNEHRGGYGSFSHGGKMVRAHRMAWQIWRGEIPSGQVVRHRCDRPCCVNPDHLELGTHLDNVQDAVERGRLRRGEQSPNAKLTQWQVDAIRADGRTYATIGSEYGVSPSSVCLIKQGKNWARRSLGVAQ